MNNPLSACILLIAPSSGFEHIFCTNSSGNPQSSKLFLAKMQGNIGDCGVTIENAKVGKCDVKTAEKSPSWVSLKREHKECIAFGRRGPFISTDSSSLFSLLTFPWRI